MSPTWMLQTLLAGALIGAGALALEKVAGWFAVPRRAVWAAAMLASLALPALSLWAPGLLPDLGVVPDPSAAAFDPGVLFPLADASTGPLAAGPVPDAGPWWRDLSVVLGLGWLASSLAVLGVLAWTYRRLRAVRAGSVPMVVDGAAVRVAERAGPAVVGLLRPAVVVPRWTLDLPAEERRLILLHEREHVARGDPWLLFLGTLAVAAMPWSLPLWWQHRRLRSAVETDCDGRVLARGASRRDYGRVLIRTAGTSPALPLLGPAWGDSTSQLERRIMTMTARRPSHRLLRSVSLVALAAGVLAAACELVRGGGSTTATRPGNTPSGAAAPYIISGQVARLNSTVRRPGDKVDSVVVPANGPIARRAATLKSSFGFVPGGGAFAGAPRKPLLVGQIRMDGSAWRAGLRPGDVVLTIDGMDTRDMETIWTVMAREPGTPYVMRVRRGDDVFEITARLEPRRSWTSR